MAKLLKVQIIDPVGLYAIPASEMVGIAKNYQCDITIAYNGKKVNMKSVMGVLSLGIPKGAMIVIEFNGHDEYVAFNQIKTEFIDRGLAKIL